MYPVRRKLGVVRLLEAEADVEGSAGVPTLRRDVWKGDNFDLSALNNVGLEVTLIKFVSDLAQGRVQTLVSATGVRPDFSVMNSLYSRRSTMSSDLNSWSGSSDWST